MELLAKGWFTETHALWPGQAFSLEVDKVLHREQSEYQDILIFQRLVRPAAKGMLELQAPTAKGMLELQAPTYS